MEQKIINKAHLTYQVVLGDCCTIGEKQLIGSTEKLSNINSIKDLKHNYKLLKCKYVDSSIYFIYEGRYVSCREIISIVKNMEKENRTPFKEYLKDKINQRNNLRKSKKYLEADRIRQELLERDVVLEDNKDGTTTWRRKI